MADWNELNELLVRVAVAHGRGAMYAALTTKEQQANEREKTRKRKSGACRRPEPSADKSDYTKPARACGTHSDWSVRLERLVTANKKRK